MMRNKVLGLVLALGLTAPWVFAREQATDAQRTAEIQDKVYHTKESPQIKLNKLREYDIVQGWPPRKGFKIGC